MRLSLVLEDLLVGGAQVHAVELGQRLSRRGLEVELVVLGAEVSASLAARWDGPLHRLHQRGLKRPGEWRRLGRVLEDLDPQLILAVGPVATCVAAAARLQGRVNGALASVFHTSTVGTLQGWLRIGPYIAAARLCDGLVFVSERQREAWTRRGLAARHVQVIRNGVDLQRHTRFDPAARVEAKVRLGLDPSVLTIGSVAMFRPEKNHAGMIQALAALRRLGLKAELLLVGDGPTRAATQALARSLGLEESVAFPGEHGDVRPFLAAMDLGLLCSTRVETLPLFGLELMASGAPMVAPRIGGLAELVDDEVDGLLFASNDNAALMRQLKRGADPVVRGRLGRAAAEKVRGFDAETMADAYAELAGRLVRARHGG